MTRPQVKEIDVTTGEEIIREMNDVEFADYSARQNKFNEKVALEEQFTAQRQALLDKLGITEEEAKLLLGGN